MFRGKYYLQSNYYSITNANKLSYVSNIFLASSKKSLFNRVWNYNIFLKEFKLGTG